MSVAAPTYLPDHTQLPETDGKPSENSFEQHQNSLLTDCVFPVLTARHPDGRFFIGQDVGIYFKHTDPPLDGCRAPDWFYVPNVSPLAADGTYRRSYVLWRELRDPFVIIEQASRGGDEERDATPETGKFWVYETVLRTPYYLIFDSNTGRLEGYRYLDTGYVPMEPNSSGRFPINGMGIELGTWRGKHLGIERTWIRFYDTNGQLLPNSDERAERERRRADQERERADRAATEADRLRAMLAKLGVNPDQAP